MSLYDLVLNLYAIPLDHAGFARERLALHDLWERTLSQFAGRVDQRAAKVFVSYSHQDEPFKNELITMLAGLQRSGAIDAWQDRRIDPGQEWLGDITRAIDESDVALLLVSPDFIASPFIHSKELPALLERRKRDGLVVVPIIVRDCLWQSEPVLKSLQVLPTDGKPVMTFPSATGDRDRVWREIAEKVEKLARAKIVQAGTPPPTV